MTKMQIEEAELLSEQRKVLEIRKDQRKPEDDEIWQMAVICMESWEPTKRNNDSIAKKAWQLNQSNETKSQNLEHDWDTLMARELGWSQEENPRS